MFQITRTLGLNFGIMSVGFLLGPWVLLMRYGKKQSSQTYAGIIIALVVGLGIANSAGSGEVSFSPAVTIPRNDPAPQQATTQEREPTPALSSSLPESSGSNVTVDTLYVDGCIRSLHTLLDGVRHGPYQLFQNPNCALSSEGSYTNGAQNWEG
ncbi:hypothetical protein OAJ07_03785, partial [Gemmatimonadales bacterium]|nr:hypothetical protein [Gemmatimonadales bacterium]